MPDTESAPPTREALTRDDAVLHGSEGSYIYPFTAEPRTFSHMPNSPWKGSLDETVRGEDGVYRKPGFDLQQSVRGVPGPILEIGGPTPRGYQLLQDIELPSKPIITDVAGSSGTIMRGWQSVTPLDKLTLGALMDVHDLPVRDNSLGMVIAASMGRTARGDRPPGVTLEAILQDRTEPEESEQSYQEALDTAESQIRSGHIELVAKSESPRIATIAQAARALKHDGLFIFKSLDPRSVQLANMLGLETVMHTPMWASDTMVHYKPDGSEENFQVYTEHIDEAMFRKP